jgi:hypothetical protein
MKINQEINRPVASLTKDVCCTPQGTLTLDSWEVSTQHEKMKAALYWSGTHEYDDKHLVKIDEVVVTKGQLVVRKLPQEGRANVFQSKGGGEGKIVVRQYVSGHNHALGHVRWDGNIEN